MTLLCGWSKLESTWQVYSILLILFHRRTIFKMLARLVWTVSGEVIF